MRRVGQGIGVGSLVTALVVGAPWWFLLVLTVAVLFLGVLTLTADQIDAFNRLLRGRRIDDVPKPQMTANRPELTETSPPVGAEPTSDKREPKPRTSRRR
ncbi:hypothetical protein [Lentzea sp. E54]|uniref:hypothetical protein n=1 Tax=Lentzea xerophila TaxID=3435883 RepID=UPI003DA26FA1